VKHRQEQKENLSKSFDLSSKAKSNQPKVQKEDLKADIMRRINKIEVFLNKNP